MKVRIYDTKSEKYRDDVALGTDEGVYKLDVSGIIEVEGCKVEKFIGLQDKNGKDIFENDLLRVRYEMGESEGWKTDFIYKVHINHEGVYLTGIDLFDKENKQLQYPIHASLSFKYSSLTTDYRNSNYDRIAINDTSSSNSHSHKTWKENHYSNDIELIGSVHLNRHLIPITTP